MSSLASIRIPSIMLPAQSNERAILSFIYAKTSHLVYLMKYVKSVCKEKRSVSSISNSISIIPRE